ncbi:unnamed protein product [Acanthosepion pharaonis]|uniref:Uncharacterized protein n=1 Tax=Acanthosepion pharaonis TaxID=158019 RepID=A0A812BRP2_ACAPH|nr:unnamed protein product [Sepia pharaonis]
MLDRGVVNGETEVNEWQMLFPTPPFSFISTYFRLFHFFSFINFSFLFFFCLLFHSSFYMCFCLSFDFLFLSFFLSSFLPSFLPSFFLSFFLSFFHSFFLSFFLSVSFLSFFFTFVSIYALYLISCPLFNASSQTSPSSAFFLLSSAPIWDGT